MVLLSEPELPMSAKHLARLRAVSGRPLSREDRLLQLGMVGLGRTGENIVRRLLNGGRRRVVFDRSTKAIGELFKAVGVPSLVEVSKKLAKSNTIRPMVSEGVVDDTVAKLLPQLEAGDILIWRHLLLRRRHPPDQGASPGSIHYVAVGTGAAQPR